jgi:hypothetical protein
MKISREFLEILTKQKSVASTDLYRTTLQGTQWIEDELLTCDGHIASVVKVNERTDGPIFFTSDDIKKIEILLKLTKNVQEFELKDKELIGANEKMSLGLDKLECPDIKRVAIEDINEGFTFALNAELLLDLAKAVTNKKSRVVRLTVDPKNKMSPIVVKGAEGRGVIMPCRF